MNLSEYYRMNMICNSSQPSTDELYDLDHCSLTCPKCGAGTNFRDMIFTATDIDDCECIACGQQRNEYHWANSAV